MSAPEDAKRRRVLEAALGVFLRFGFRKTSMDEVARAASISRQGLYLHFATKEELFRATLEHTVGASLVAAAEALDDASCPLPARLVRAFDEWVGRYVGIVSTGAADLAEVSGSLGGTILADADAQFVDVVAKSLRASGLVARYKSCGLNGRQLAETLYATARGLKHKCPTREAFGQSFALAVRAMCMPLEEDR